MITTVLPASGAPVTTSGGRSSSRTSSETRQLAQPLELRPHPLEVLRRGTPRPSADVLDLPQRLAPASATSSSEPNPARHRRAAVPSDAIGMAQADQRAPQPDVLRGSIDSTIRSARTSPMRSNSSSCSRVSA